jgi:hypothetical protein
MLQQNEGHSVDVYGRSGRIYLGKRLGSGGEAEVFEVLGSHRAAKIYRNTLSPADLHHKQRKIEAMVEMTPADPGVRIGHVSLAWPAELLFDSKRRFCGYFMPRAESLGTLSIVSNPAGRQLASMAFDPRYLHRTGANLAMSVGAVHRIGHCIGDFNPGNVLVTNRALVTLIDTDSFQIVDRHGRLYGCGVGIDQYLAPERVRGGMVTPEQDSFVLAVLLFQLVMGGFHPFDGGAVIAAHSTAQLPLAEYLRQGVFPFISNRQAQPPDGAPNFALLRHELRDAFQKTFITGHRNPLFRVSVGEWVGLFERAEKDLVQCRRDKEHLYYQSVGTCIWCEQKHRTRAQAPLPPQRTVAPPRPSAPATAPVFVPPVTTARRVATAGAAVTRRIDLRYFAVVLLIILIGGISSRARFREEVTTDTVALDTSMTDTMATDTMVTDTMSTTAVAATTSATDTTSTTPTDPLIAAGSTIDDVRLFASATSELPPPEERMYNTTFERVTTKNLGWQLELTNTAPPADRQNFIIQAQFLDAQNQLVVEQQLETWLEPEWPSSWHAKVGIDPSVWPAGEYKLEVNVAGRTLATRIFNLVEPRSGFSNLNVRVVELKLFVSDSEIMPLNQRQYTDRFSSTTLRWLGWQLDISHAAQNTGVPFQLEAVVWRDGNIIARETNDFNVRGTWESSSHQAIINAWSWTAGNYTLQILSDGIVIASRSFVLS